jgi:hypothetical protein
VDDVDEFKRLLFGLPELEFVQFSTDGHTYLKLSAHDAKKMGVVLVGAPCFILDGQLYAVHACKICSVHSDSLERHYLLEEAGKFVRRHKVTHVYQIGIGPSLGDERCLFLRGARCAV